MATNYQFNSKFNTFDKQFLKFYVEIGKRYSEFHIKFTFNHFPAHKLHLSELSALHDTRIRDLTQQDERHGAEAEAIRAEARKEFEASEARWRIRVKEREEEGRKRLEEAGREHSSREERWAESRRSLEEQVRGLQQELREQEEQARIKGKGDLQLQAAHRKIEKVTAEVDSLKAVLELKTQEVRRKFYYYYYFCQF